MAGHSRGISHWSAVNGRDWRITPPKFFDFAMILRELWIPGAFQPSGGGMSILKPFGAFLAAMAVSLSVGVAYAYGTSLGDDPAHGAPVQDLPDLGSPANAAISLEDEYQ